MNRTYLVYNHQHKADKYISALQNRAYVYNVQAAVILMDVDTAGRINQHRNNLKSGKSKVFTYPHSARVNLAWDGIFRGSPYTAATFVTACGHEEILRAYGYKKNIHITGWTYCDTLPFQPNANPKKILFAPIHPNKNGFLSQLDQGINKATFERLLKLFRRGEIDLSIRHIGTLMQNGLWHEDGVKYMEGHADLSYKNIDENDLVVAHQTFAYIAMARGKPVLMMAEDIPPRNTVKGEETRYVASWEAYKEMVMYPLDILSHDDTMMLIRRAALSDSEVSTWKHRMIGSPFDPNTFVNIIESYYKE